MITIYINIRWLVNFKVLKIYFDYVFNSLLMHIIIYA